MVARQNAPRIASAAQASFFTRPFMRSPSVRNRQGRAWALGGQCANDAAVQKQAKTLVVGRGAEGLPERDPVCGFSRELFHHAPPPAPVGAAEAATVFRGHGIAASAAPT